MRSTAKIAGSERELEKSWKTIASVASRITSERQYERVQTLLNYWLDRVGSDERHPMIGLVDYLGYLISEYEKENVPEPEGTPADALRYLMEEHDLTQADIAGILKTSQGNVSKIMSGQRRLNVRQVKALAVQFNVSHAVFID